MIEQVMGTSNSFKTRIYPIPKKGNLSFFLLPPSASSPLHIAHVCVIIAIVSRIVAINVITVILTY